LAEWIVRFFRTRSFRTLTEQTGRRYKIVVIPSHEHDIREDVKVHVHGESDNFSVRFVAGTRSETFVKLGRLTSLLGGGVLFKWGWDSLDALEKLEREFWKYVGEKVDQLGK
jgi:hypothetical protein